MKDGYIKVAAATPSLRVADTVYNAKACIDIASDANESGVKVLVFPELALTGYSCGDLFFSETLLSGALEALKDFMYSTAVYDMVSIIGLPLKFNENVYNCAAVVSGGQVLGFVPKSYIPKCIESNENRVFEAAPADNFAYVFEDSVVMFGIKQMFVCREMPLLKIGIEIGEDTSAPLSPSVFLTSGGATVIANLGASAEIIGKEEFLRNIINAQSAKTVSGYIYAGAGVDESTSSVVYWGHCLISEIGNVLAEKKPFDSCNLIISELDLQNVAYDRRKNSLLSNRHNEVEFSEIEFDLFMSDTDLTRKINSHPFIPSDESELSERCKKVLNIQKYALARRIEASYSKKIIVGISGGLDSCLALLVMVSAIDSLNRDRKDIIAVTMPCFGTTERTKNNAEILCEQLGVDFRQIDIFDAVKQHFYDIGHDMNNHNVVYENAQARERTQILMDIANAEGGIVVGTGDLSELALGWATYNGDHMSMYGVNASIPKTFIRYVVKYYADVEIKNGNIILANAIYDILETPVSPELLPASEGEIIQKTEELVGPYELHDFFMYYFVRHGCGPKKLFRLARIAFCDKYEDQILIKWLEVFIRRFFSQQFKRSCLPDGPKVGSVALSTKSFNIPSDVVSSLWLNEVQEIKNELI